MSTAHWIVALAAVALALPACTERVEIQSGGSCERNSQCASPLVCRLERCRKECLGSRDCAAGLRCIAVSSEVGGVCQLPQERECVLSSECDEPLVCRFGTCTTVCAEDRDCVDGATCETDDMGAAACVEPVAELCIYHSDCPDDLICDHDQVCRPECLDDRDCRYPRICSADSVCVLQ